MADKEETVRRGYQAFGEGDMEHFRAIYTPDVVQRVPGNNQISGEHEGVDNVLGLYGRFFELSGGTFSVELTSVKTQGDKVVAAHHAKGEREGKTLDVDGPSSSRSRATGSPASTWGPRTRPPRTLSGVN